VHINKKKIFFIRMLVVSQYCGAIYCLFIETDFSHMIFVLKVGFLKQKMIDVQCKTTLELAH